MILPYKKGKTGEWISETYMAMARLNKWFYCGVNSISYDNVSMSLLWNEITPDQTATSTPMRWESIFTSNSELKDSELKDSVIPQAQIKWLEFGSIIW